MHVESCLRNVLSSVPFEAEAAQWYIVIIGGKGGGLGGTPPLPHFFHPMSCSSKRMKAMFYESLKTSNILGILGKKQLWVALHACCC